MSSKADSLDVKLLLYAIQKTTSFEKTLAQRFMQSSFMEEVREGEGGREGGGGSLQGVSCSAEISISVSSRVKK